MDQYNHYFEANRTLWNKRTTVHKDSQFYDLPSFLNGNTSLKKIELDELGDVRGKKILHLQCHFGMDTLSLARMGAIVTGVDLSDEAIEEAKRLNNQLGLKARFICCNVYDLPHFLEEQFDIVFTSYGVIGWLPDLEAWARVINTFLKPGGFFYMAEFHPVVWMLDEDFQKVKYYYHNEELIEIDSVGTYTDRYANIEAKEYSWNHSISEVLNALLHQNLQLKFFNEFSYSPFPCFNNVVEGSDGNWRVKDLEDKIPMVYSLKAVKGVDG
ncbi:MAG TPA: class I SAM-dependent methyltransferase [Chitinophagaceae bacterium]|nr:class I SAM-dependent methyltransferase [Chitinophagaceae bacterium]